MKKFLPNIFVWLIGLSIGAISIYGMVRIEPVIIMLAWFALAVAIIVYRKPELGIFAITFFLPFERIGSYDVMNFTVRLSQLFTLLTLIAWLAHGIINKKITIKKNPLFSPLLFFFLINVLSLLNTANYIRSLTTLAITTFTIILSLLLPNMITSEQLVKKVVRVLFVSTVIVSLFGIYQFVGDIIGLPSTLTGLRPLYTKDILGFPRVQSTALEPLYYANFLFIPLGIAYALLLNKKSGIPWYQLLLIVLLGGINLVLTVSRGGYIAAAVIFGLITIYYFKRFFTLKNVVVCLISLTVIIWGFFYFFNFQQTLDKFIEHTVGIFQGASYNERVQTFEMAMNAFAEHPVLGIGVGDFGPYAAIHPYVMPDSGWLIVNNEFLELLAEVGILGFGSFLVVIAIILVRCMKAINKAKDPYQQAVIVGVGAAFIGMLIQYQTFSTLYIMHVWFLIGFMVSVQNLILKPEGKKKQI